MNMRIALVLAATLLVAGCSTVTFEQTEMLPEGTAYPGQTDVTVLKFSVTADDEAATLKKIAFLLNGNGLALSTATLYADINGDGVADDALDNAPNFSLGAFEFGNIMNGAGLRIDKGDTIDMEVRADFSMQQTMEYTTRVVLDKIDASIFGYESVLIEKDGGAPYENVEIDGVCNAGSQKKCEIRITKPQSTIFTIVPPPPDLTIDVLPTDGLGGAGTTTPSTGSTVLRFSATAGNAPVALARLILVIDYLSDIPGELDSLSLWENVPGQTAFTQIASIPHNNFPCFRDDVCVFQDSDPIMTTLQAGESRQYEIRMHINVPRTYASFANMRLEVSNTSRDCMINNTDTACENVVVNNRSHTPVSFSRYGNLFITKSALPVFSRQLLGGGADHVLKLNLRADYWDIWITDLVFTGTGASSLTKNIASIDLYANDQKLPVSATATACDIPTSRRICAKFSNGQLTVPINSPVELAARAVMKTDEQGSQSNDVVQLYIDDARGIAVGTNSQLFPASPTGSWHDRVYIGTDTFGPSQKVTGPEHRVVHTYLLSVANADTNPNGTVMSTGTNKPLGQFKFKTMNNSNTKTGVNNWALYGLIFDVAAANMLLDAGQFKFYNKADPSNKVSCTASTPNATGNFTVTCTDLVDQVGVTIGPDSEAVFVLEGAVTSAPAGSSLQVSLTSINDMTKTSFSPASSHIQWVDKDNSTSTIFRWVDSTISGTVNSTLYRN